MQTFVDWSILISVLNTKLCCPSDCCCQYYQVMGSRTCFEHGKNEWILSTYDDGVLVVNASNTKARPDLSIKNSTGDTALDVAAKKENRAIYGVLLGYKYASTSEQVKDVDATMQRNRAESMSRASAALEKHKMESIRAKKERDQLEKQLQEQEQQRLEATRKIEELEKKAAEAAMLVQREAEERSKKEAKAKELEAEMQKLASNLTEEAAKAQREAELRQQVGCTLIYT